MELAQSNGWNTSPVHYMNSRPVYNSYGYEEHKKIYTDWVNHYLDKAGYQQTVKDLQTDVSDGLLLANIIHAVLNENVDNLFNHPQNEAHLLTNIEACLNCLAAKGVNVEGITSKDIKNGNLKSVLGLFFSLSRFKQQSKQAQIGNLSKSSSRGKAKKETEMISRLPAPKGTRSQPTPPVTHNNIHNAATAQSVLVPGSSKPRTGAPRNPQDSMPVSQRSGTHAYTQHHSNLANGSSIPHPSVKVAKVAPVSKSSSMQSSTPASAANKKHHHQQQQQPTSVPQHEKSINSSSGNKNKVLDKFRFFGSGSNSKNTTATPESGSATKSQAAFKEQHGAKKTEKHSSHRAKSESSSSVGTVSSLSAGSSSSSSATAASGNSKSAFKAVRSLGKAFKNSPKSAHKDMGAKGEADKHLIAPVSNLNRYSGSSNGSSSGSSLSTEKKMYGVENSGSRAAVLNSNEGQSSLRKGSKIASLATKGAKSPHAITSGKPPSGASGGGGSQIPQPKLTKAQAAVSPTGKNGTMLTGTSGNATSNATQNQDEKSRFVRNTSMYSTVPGPSKQRTVTLKPYQPNGGGDSKRINSPSDPKKSLLAAATNVPTTAASGKQSPGGGANKAQLSKNEVATGKGNKKSPQEVTNPKVFPSEEVHTTFNNNKAVTTFGSSKQQRQQQQQQQQVETGSTSNSHAQQLPSSAGKVPPLAGLHTTLETTFDSNNDVVTQVSHYSPFLGRKLTMDSSASALAQHACSHSQYMAGFSSAHSAASALGTLPRSSRRKAAPLQDGASLSHLLSATSNSHLYLPSIHRTVSNRTNLCDIYMGGGDDVANPVNEDIATGYMSDGTVMAVNESGGSQRNGDLVAGYMSDGGGLLYNKKMAANFHTDMQALRDCLQKSNLLDEDSFDDSSSLSSGISDTIADMSTDENNTATTSSSLSSAPNTPATNRKLKLPPKPQVPAAKKPSTQESMPTSPPQSSQKKAGEENAQADIAKSQQQQQQGSNWRKYLEVDNKLMQQNGDSAECSSRGANADGVDKNALNGRMKWIKGSGGGQSLHWASTSPPDRSGGGGGMPGTAIWRKSATEEATIKVGSAGKVDSGQEDRVFRKSSGSEIVANQAAVYSSTLSKPSISLRPAARNASTPPGRGDGPQHFGESAIDQDANYYFSDAELSSRYRLGRPSQPPAHYISDSETAVASLATEKHGKQSAARHGISAKSFKQLFERTKSSSAGKGSEAGSGPVGDAGDTIISNPLTTSLVGKANSLSVTSSLSFTPEQYKRANGALQQSGMYSGAAGSPYMTSSLSSGQGAMATYLSESMESVESTNSSQFSGISRGSTAAAASSPMSTNLVRTNSIRSTTSERFPPTSLALHDFDKLRSNSYCNLTGEVQATSPTGNLSHQSSGRLTYPMVILSPVSGNGPNMSRSNSMSGEQQHIGNTQLRNSAVSLDDRARAMDFNDCHSSSLSLVSTTSSIYSTPEEKAASIIRKLKRELETSTDKILTLTTQMSTNAHVVAAFEKSLSNMTTRLQKLTNSADKKDSELKALRETIEELKRQSAEASKASSDIVCKNSSLVNSKKDKSKGVKQERRNSSESINSITSLSSTGVCTDTELEEKKKKKNWIKSSFKSPFSKKKAKSGCQTDVEDLDSNPSSPSSPSYSGNAILKPSASTSAIFDSQQQDAMDSLQEMRKQLKGRESQLTELRLDALSSQHQIYQYRETVARLKSDISSLKQENERLHRQLINRSVTENTVPVNHHTAGEAKDTTASTSLIVSDIPQQLIAIECHGSCDNLADGTTSNGKRVIVAVACSEVSSGKASVDKSQEVYIGTLSVGSKTKWDVLDSVVKRVFKDYVLRIDPVSNLGLNAESIHSYTIGEISRCKDSEVPELLPVGYLVGANHSISINLKGVQENSYDSLAFETLIPKSMMQRYMSLLLEHRRIILCGPSGTGKTYLAHKLAKHLVQRSGKAVTEGSVVTFNVDHKSSKELKQYLSGIAEQADSSEGEAATVVILDNLHQVSSLGDIFNGFLNCKLQTCPYIIGTMNQASCSTTNLQLHHNFRWVLCANHTEPVKGFLGRYLRRKLVETEVKTNVWNNDLIKTIDWMPKVWQHLNKFLETHSSSDVTIGPRLFLSCPVEVAGSQVWFTDLWNYSIIPYLLEAVREGLQLYGRKASWEDPADWVIDSYPWSLPSSQEWPSLLHLRPEDVGFDSCIPQGSGPKNVSSMPSEAERDPLLNMLIHLQEAANYSSPQGSDPSGI